MPVRMSSPFQVEELTNMSFTKEFTFSKGANVMRIPTTVHSRSFEQGTRLYDLKNDPEQLFPIKDEETERRLTLLMKQLMRQNEAPKEQYERMGIPI